MSRSDLASRTAMRVKTALVGIVAITCTLAGTASAQDTCARLIAEAADAYKVGRLDEALDRAAACLTRKPSAEEREQVHALRANVFLALDQVREAETEASVLLGVNPEFAPAAQDSDRFRVLLTRLKRERAADAVSSVSKMRESLLEAPATVVVVTAEQIRRRGYIDLEGVLHDLPGFDVARTNGVTYSNAFQRGYQSDATNRTLFLVDGVEQNDLFSNIAYISHQYPLSSIARIEVVYGPASTMYGANAFLGVINVVTRDPEESVPEGKKFAADARLGGGAWGTSYIDATAAGRGRSVSYSVTGRLFRSDEWDLSRYPNWDYAADASYEGRFSRSESLPNFAQILNRAKALDRAALDSVNGQPVTYSDLSKDWMLLGKLQVKDFLFGVQMWQTREGTAGASTKWTEPGAHNGAVWVPFQAALSARYSTALRGNVRLTYFGQAKIHELQPDSAVFVRHSYRFQLDESSLSVSTPPFWAQTYLAQSSNQVRHELNLVVRPRTNIDVISGVDLRNSSIQSDYSRDTNCGVRFSPVPVAQNQTLPMLLRDGYVDLDRNIFFTPALYQYVLSGRASQFLGFEDSRPRCGGKLDGELTPPDRGGEHFAGRDFGVFGQVSYRPVRSVKLVGGWRLDNGSVDLRKGYGNVGTPRFAFTYSPGPLVAKVIYAEAFKEPANLERFSTIPGIRDTPSTGLEPERVRNLEFAVGRQTTNYTIDVSAYRSRYSNVIGVSEISAYDQLNTDEFHHFSDDFARRWYFTSCFPVTTCLLDALDAIPDAGTRRSITDYFLNSPALGLSYDNQATLDVVGGQVNGTWRRGIFDLFGNYSYIEPRPTRVTGQARRPNSIARHHGNIGLSAGGERLSAGVRFNLVGSRGDTDKEASSGLVAYLAQQSESPFGEPVETLVTEHKKLPAYAVAHLTARYAPVRGLAVQLVINNLFNTSYAHPGVQAADDVRFAASVPQPGRAAFVQISTGF